MNSKLTIEDIKSILEREDNYYDFKEEYHQSKNNKELLKDILSLANCKHNGNRYIFFGIAEEKGKFVIKGIENTKNRKKLVDIQSCLDSKFFACERVPSIDLYIVKDENNHEIDVLEIKDEKFKPYFLIKDYENVKSHKIYTRHHDQKSEANSHEIIHMWKEQFGLTGDVKEKFKNLLKNVSQWDYNNNSFVNIAFPEYKIIINKERINPGKDAFMLFYESCVDYICTSKFIVGNTEIYSCNYTIFEDVAEFPNPKMSLTSHLSDYQTHGFYYYIRDSFEYLLFNLCEYNKLTFNERGFEFPYIVINDEDELDSFGYFLNNEIKFEDLDIKDNSLIELPPTYLQNLNIDSLRKNCKLYRKFKNKRNK